MTEPTWKDPLCAALIDESWELLHWAAVRAGKEPKPGGMGSGLFDEKWPSLNPAAARELYDRVVRLRSLIDAELARGREAVELLTKHQWAGMMGAICRECDHGSTRGHAPDCRLAKVIA